MQVLHTLVAPNLNMVKWMMQLSVRRLCVHNLASDRLRMIALLCRCHDRMP